MAAHLIGVNEWKTLENQGHAGPMVETWVACELQKLMPVLDHRFRLYFWRTQTGQEVDFLIERAGKVVAIEVKWGHRIDESDVKHLNRLAEDLKERLLFSVILYSGVEGVPLGPKIVAMPFPVFFGI
jgi:predicted AAA+ superfamily ATPase